MKKSDLVNGKHIVETKDGERYLVAGDYLPHIYDKGFMLISDYTESLFRITCFKDESEKMDICRVYEIIIYNSLGRLCEYTNTLKLVWERKPELSEVERVILENLYRDSNYITRDESGELWLFENRPIKKDYSWDLLNGFGENFSLYKYLFKMVKWGDEEPTLIADLLNE